MEIIKGCNVWFKTSGLKNEYGCITAWLYDMYYEIYSYDKNKYYYVLPEYIKQ